MVNKKYKIWIKTSSDEILQNIINNYDLEVNFYYSYTIITGFYLKIATQKMQLTQNF